MGALRGRIRGKTIELEQEPGLPEGQAVAVQIQPLVETKPAAASSQEAPPPWWLERLDVDPNVVRGRVIIKGTRLQAETLVALREEGRAEEELLRTYPNSEDAPEAMVYIAETYAAERNQAAADSVYGLVVQRFPRSPKAATALYKRAQMLRSAGQGAAARAALERIVREYPRSDEAALAREQLRTLGR